MKILRKRFVVPATFTLLTVFTMPNLAASQALTSLLATAKGQGTITVGQEVLKVSNVVVKLKEDATCEVTLVTDFQLFITCTWSAPADLSKGVDLKVTGGTSAGGAQGSGKLLLRPDGKAINSLSIDASSNAAKRKIQVRFVAD